MKRVLPVLFILLGACNSFDIEGSQPMAPLSIYREWWNKTEACSGLKGNYERIDWFIVPGHSFECSSGECAGHWHGNHTIFLAEDYFDHEMVVRHEMLHDLLDKGGHPDLYFKEKCQLTWDTWNKGADRMRARLMKVILPRL